jgi:hypothetical protein
MDIKNVRKNLRISKTLCLIIPMNKTDGEMRLTSR